MDRLSVSYEKIFEKCCKWLRQKKLAGWLLQGVRALAVVLACYGWWGVIYPELTMLPSTYEIVYDDPETVQKSPEVVEWNSDSQIYWKILETDPEQIRFKSRLLTMLKE